MTGGIFIKRVVLISSLSFVFFLGKVKSESSLTDEEVKFFESKIRPVLVEQCYAAIRQRKN